MRTLKGTVNIGFEDYFNMEQIIKSIYIEKRTKYKICDSLLLTPFYLDSKTYEMYWYDLNICLIDDDVYKQKILTCDQAYKIDNRQTIQLEQMIYVSKSHPYVEIQSIESYINFLFANEDLRKEIEKVFSKQFDSSKMYFSIY